MLYLLGSNTRRSQIPRRSQTMRSASDNSQEMDSQIDSLQAQLAESKVITYWLRQPSWIEVMYSPLFVCLSVCGQDYLWAGSLWTRGHSITFWWLFCTGYPDSNVLYSNDFIRRTIHKHNHMLLHWQCTLKISIKQNKQKNISRFWICNTNFFKSAILGDLLVKETSYWCQMQ